MADKFKLNTGTDILNLITRKFFNISFLFQRTQIQMAEKYDDSGLKEAMLQVWTPAVGLQSIEEIWCENLMSIFLSDIHISDALLDSLVRKVFLVMSKFFCLFGFNNREQR